jgi:hypothetical protein
LLVENLKKLPQQEMIFSVKHVQANDSLELSKVELETLSFNSISYVI